MIKTYNTYTKRYEYDKPKVAKATLEDRIRKLEAVVDRLVKAKTFKEFKS